MLFLLVVITGAAVEEVVVVVVVVDVVEVVFVGTVNVAPMLVRTWNIRVVTKVVLKISFSEYPP